MSKRRSRSKEPRPPKIPRLVLDECIRSYALRDALRADGIVADLSVELFGVGLTDEELFPKVRRLGAAFVTKDHAIGRQPARQRALIEQRLAAIFLAHEELMRGEMISSMRASYARLERFTGRYRPPYIIRITPSGHLDLIHREKGTPRRR